MRTYYIYFLASKKDGVLYTGVTNDLRRRVYEHRNGLVDGFTKQYHVHRLVYFECATDVKIAIEREKKLKRWRRQWKIDLITRENPIWRDLYAEL